MKQGLTALKAGNFLNGQAHKQVTTIAVRFTLQSNYIASKAVSAIVKKKKGNCNQWITKRK